MWGLTLAFLIILSIGYLKLSDGRKEDYGRHALSRNFYWAGFAFSSVHMLIPIYSFFRLNDIMGILMVSLHLLLSKFFAHLIVLATLLLQLGCTYEVILASRKKLTLLNLLELSTSNCGCNRWYCSLSLSENQECVLSIFWNLILFVILMCSISFW